MFDVFCLGLALTVGQGGPVSGPLPPPPTTAGRVAVGDDLPRRIPAALPAVTVVPPTPLPGPAPGEWVSTQQKDPTAPTEPKGAVDTPKQDAEAKDPEEKKNGTEEKKNGTEEKKNGDEEKKNGEEKKDDRGYFMRVIDEKYLGGYVKSNDLRVDGWIAFSYNASTRDVTNLPVTWNDRADVALLQQFWVNITKPVDWEKCEVQEGFNVSMFYGSDYRFTLPRGFLNNQLKNWRPDPRELNGFEQNIYGFDVPQFYYNVWLPGVGGKGTEILVGRFFTPFGYESVMAPTTPLMSRSYTFNWAPPFFHVGVMATTQVDKTLTFRNAIVNGNDVFFDGSDECRYVGSMTLTSEDGDTFLSLGTSFGRGRFNPREPNGPAQGITTIGLAYEPAGRNNINVFDLVYSTKLDKETTYAFEAIYGYQYNVPAGATGSPRNFGGRTGTATWCGFVNYLFHNFTDQWTGVCRFEVFCDNQGQRTGFEGTYYSTTLGLQCRPCDEVLIRPEIRYDYNPYSRPFTGRHDILVAGFDLIVKY